jgi:hypothetical protein
MRTATPSIGVILPDAWYREDEAGRQLGFGRHAMSEAKKRGMKVHRFGKRNFIQGAEIIRAIQADAEERAAAV